MSSSQLYSYRNGWTSDAEARVYSQLLPHSPLSAACSASRTGAAAESANRAMLGADADVRAGTRLNAAAVLRSEARQTPPPLSHLLRLKNRSSSRVSQQSHALCRCRCRHQMQAQGSMQSGLRCSKLFYSIRLLPLQLKEHR